MKQKTRRIIIASSIAVAVMVAAILSYPLVVMYRETFGFPWHYWGWKTVEISDLCSFKVPNKWIVTQTENTIYLTDKPMSEEGYRIIFLGTTRIEKEDEFVDPADLVENMGEGEYVKSESFSSGASIITREYDYAGNLIERNTAYLSELSSDNSFERKIELLCLDESIDYGMLKKIAISFEKF